MRFVGNTKRPYNIQQKVLSFAYLIYSIVEFVEQCSHLLSSSNVGRVVKEKRLQLGDEILLEFHYKRPFAFTRLRYFTMGQKFEF